MTRGRPKGSKNIKTIADVIPSRCPSCGSSRRTAYENPYYQDYSGHRLEFEGIWYRACKCLTYGKPRRDCEKVYPGCE
jgi:hypothetical protein